MGQVGDLLRTTRETKGLSLAQVEEITRIRRKILEVLEQGAYDQLPAPVFVKGFLRNYANLLGLNPEEIIQQYKEEAGEAARPYTPTALAEPLESRPIFTPLAVLFLILILTMAAWWSYQQGWVTIPRLPIERLFGASRQTVTPSVSPTEAITPTLAATDTPTPAATPTDAPTLAPTETATLTGTPTLSPTSAPTATLTRTPSPTSLTTSAAGLHAEFQFQAKAWFIVYSDGRKVFDGLVERGTMQKWDAAQQIYVYCGYGSGVRATVNGQEYGQLSAEPDTVRIEWTLAPGTPSVSEAVAPTQVILSSGTSTPPLRATPTATR